MMIILLLLLVVVVVVYDYYYYWINHTGHTGLWAQDGDGAVSLTAIDNSAMP